MKLSHLALVEPRLTLRSGRLETLAEPLIGIFKQGWKIIDPGNRRPFYEGAMEHPGERRD